MLTLALKGNDDLLWVGSDCGWGELPESGLPFSMEDVLAELLKSGRSNLVG